MTFGLTIFLMIVSITAIIIGAIKKSKKAIVIASICFVVVFMFGIALFMALGAM